MPGSRDQRCRRDSARKHIEEALDAIGLGIGRLRHMHLAREEVKSEQQLSIRRKAGAIFRSGLVMRFPAATRRFLKLLIYGRLRSFHLHHLQGLSIR